MEWFIENRPDLTGNVAAMDVPGEGQRLLMSIVDAEQLRRILAYVLDENEFLSPYGIRSLSKVHENQPYVFRFDGHQDQVDYEPAESRTALFGGNSNWRGPVWFPLNFLLIEALQRFHYYYGDSFTVECPTGSGNQATLWQVAEELSRRLVRLFLKDEQGRRPANGDASIFATDPTGRIWCSSTSTSTGTMAPGSEPTTRPAGQVSSPNCSSRPVSERLGTGRSEWDNRSSNHPDTGAGGEPPSVFLRSTRVISVRSAS